MTTDSSSRITRVAAYEYLEEEEGRAWKDRVGGHQAKVPNKLLITKECMCQAPKAPTSPGPISVHSLALFATAMMGMA